MDDPGYGICYRECACFRRDYESLPSQGVPDLLSNDRKVVNDGRREPGGCRSSPPPTADPPGLPHQPGTPGTPPQAQLLVRSVDNAETFAESSLTTASQARFSLSRLCEII